MNKEYTTSNLPERGSMRTAVCGCETFIIISHAHATISFMNKSPSLSPPHRTSPPQNRSVRNNHRSIPLTWVGCYKIIVKLEVASARDESRVPKKYY